MKLFHMGTAQLNLSLFTSSINTHSHPRLPQTSMLRVVTFFFHSCFFFFFFRLTYGRNEILILCNWFVSLYTMVSQFPRFPFIKHNCILLYGWWTHMPPFFISRSLFLPCRKSSYPNTINNDRVGMIKRYFNK